MSGLDRHQFFIFICCTSFGAIFFRGQFSTHRPQRMHSPSRMGVSPNFRLTGQFFRQSWQRGMQLSPLRFNLKNGSSGSRENTAPRGQRNWQKNLSFTAIPAISKRSKGKASPKAPTAKFPAVNRENTVHGLYFVTMALNPQKQSSNMNTSTAYFSFCSTGNAFSGISGRRFPVFFCIAWEI